MVGLTLLYCSSPPTMAFLCITALPSFHFALLKTKSCLLHSPSSSMSSSYQPAAIKFSKTALKTFSSSANDDDGKKTRSQSGPTPKAQTQALSLSLAFKNAYICIIPLGRLSNTISTPREYVISISGLIVCSGSFSAQGHRNSQPRSTVTVRLGSGISIWLVNSRPGGVLSVAGAIWYVVRKCGWGLWGRSCNCTGYRLQRR